jgi:hypothetical protein
MEIRSPRDPPAQKAMSVPPLTELPSLLGPDMAGGSRGMLRFLGQQQRETGPDREGERDMGKCGANSDQRDRARDTKQHQQTLET